MMIHGIMNIYKEKGYTSHDVVAKLRGILRQKKIGHTGTLDPEAEGVLPVCLGAGTKLCDMLTDKNKTYRAVLLLGQTTDTQDTTGEVLTRHEVRVSEHEVCEAVESFIGEYDQIPPMYSALKVNGKKLYELAREGKTVERRPRRVQISEIRIEEIRLPRVTLTVTCSKGTYIRTLCQDIGERLGCGGCMEQLTRTRVGMFTIEESLTLSRVEELVKNGDLSKAVRTVDAMFSDQPAFQTVPEADRMLYNGNMLLTRQVRLKEGRQDCRGGAEETDGMVRMYDSKEQFCGIYTYRAERDCYQPEKMFLTFS